MFYDNYDPGQDPRGSRDLLASKGDFGKDELCMHGTNELRTLHSGVW